MEPKDTAEEMDLDSNYQNQTANNLNEQKLTQNQDQTSNKINGDVNSQVNETHIRNNNNQQPKNEGKAFISDSNENLLKLQAQKIEETKFKAEFESQQQNQKNQVQRQNKDSSSSPSSTSSEDDKKKKTQNQSNSSSSSPRQQNVESEIIQTYSQKNQAFKDSDEANLRLQSADQKEIYGEKQDFKQTQVTEKNSKLIPDESQIKKGTSGQSNSKQSNENEEEKIEKKEKYNDSDSDKSDEDQDDNDDDDERTHTESSFVVEVSPKGRFQRYGEELGRGAYKIVYKGIDNETGREIAWNVINFKRMPKQDRVRIKSEIDLIKILQHKNIIHFISAWVNKQKEKVIFITEMITGGSLRQFVKKIKRPRLRVIKGWCSQILQGLVYLHEQKPHPIIHRDLKCDNVFINSHSGEIRIGDLGLSTPMQNSYTTSVLGTPEFMAPELYEECYGTSVDIYAFGMCMLEMITLERPYKECQNPAQIYNKVIQGIRPQALERIEDEEIKEFILQCLTRADQRPEAKDLLESKFMKDLESEKNNKEVKVKPPTKIKGIKRKKSLEYLKMQGRTIFEVEEEDSEEDNEQKKSQVIKGSEPSTPAVSQKLEKQSSETGTTNKDNQQSYIKTEISEKQTEQLKEQIPQTQEVKTLDEKKENYEIMEEGQSESIIDKKKRKSGLKKQKLNESVTFLNKIDKQKQKKMQERSKIQNLGDNNEQDQSQFQSQNIDNDNDSEKEDVKVQENMLDELLQQDRELEKQKFEQEQEKLKQQQELEKLKQQQEQEKLKQLQKQQKQQLQQIQELQLQQEQDAQQQLKLQQQTQSLIQAKQQINQQQQQTPIIQKDQQQQQWQQQQQYSQSQQQQHHQHLSHQQQQQQISQQQPQHQQIQQLHSQTNPLAQINHNQLSQALNQIQQKQGYLSENAQVQTLPQQLLAHQDSSNQPKKLNQAGISASSQNLAFLATQQQVNPISTVEVKKEKKEASTLGISKKQFKEDAGAQTQQKQVAGSTTHTLRSQTSMVSGNQLSNKDDNRVSNLQPQDLKQININSNVGFVNDDSKKVTPNPQSTSQAMGIQNVNSLQQDNKLKQQHLQYYHQSSDSHLSSSKSSFATNQATKASQQKLTHVNSHIVESTQNQESLFDKQSSSEDNSDKNHDSEVEGIQLPRSQMDDISSQNTKGYPKTPYGDSHPQFGRQSTEGLNPNQIKKASTNKNIDYKNSVTQQVYQTFTTQPQNSHKQQQNANLQYNHHKTQPVIQDHDRQKQQQNTGHHQVESKIQQQSIDQKRKEPHQQISQQQLQQKISPGQASQTTQGQRPVQQSQQYQQSQQSSQQQQVSQQPLVYLLQSKQLEEKPYTFQITFKVRSQDGTQDQEVLFEFDNRQDTAKGVAEEMVRELDLPQSQILVIENVIQSIVSKKDQTVLNYQIENKQQVIPKVEIQSLLTQQTLKKESPQKISKDQAQIQFSKLFESVDSFFQYMQGRNIASINEIIEAMGGQQEEMQLKSEFLNQILSAKKQYKRGMEELKKKYEAKKKQQSSAQLSDAQNMQKSSQDLKSQPIKQTISHPNPSSQQQLSSGQYSQIQNQQSNNKKSQNNDFEYKKIPSQVYISSHDDERKHVSQQSQQKLSFSIPNYVRKEFKVAPDRILIPQKLSQNLKKVKDEYQNTVDEEVQSLQHMLNLIYEVSVLQMKQNKDQESQNTVQNYLPLRIDGIFGDKTESQVIKFQKHVKVAEDGVVNDVLWANLITFVDHIVKEDQKKQAQIQQLQLQKQLEQQQQQQQQQQQLQQQKEVKQTQAITNISSQVQLINLNQASKIVKTQQNPSLSQFSQQNNNNNNASVKNLNQNALQQAMISPKTQKSKNQFNQESDNRTFIEHNFNQQNQYNQDRNQNYDEYRIQQNQENSENEDDQ
ncbi:mitogen activated protein kinase family [Stylonychia lemnae]|uniref:Mitogen activated protein kinase family n=1 Tax=Stylonychia lemnae TaxID=5949 RepID=A0A078AL67_STYLE|nr:mitogen activated protein kinase family [Stylonychia lemnae]|eukprot:CDW81608.1 mitogen activated protein kinase family [Stylonychia lemnae]